MAAALRMTTRCSCSRMIPLSGRKSSSSARCRSVGAGSLRRGFGFTTPPLYDCSPRQCGLTGPSAILGALADADAQEPADRFQHAATNERDWQSDEEDSDTEEQREPGRAKQRHESLKGCSLPV